MLFSTDRGLHVQNTQPASKSRAQPCPSLRTGLNGVKKRLSARGCDKDVLVGVEIHPIPPLRKIDNRLLQPHLIWRFGGVSSESNPMELTHGHVRQLRRTKVKHGIALCEN
jgi:hypothetical protein